MTLAHLLSWLEPAWSLDTAAASVKAIRMIERVDVPDAELAAVRDEVQTIMVGIMEAYQIPAPVRCDRPPGSPPVDPSELAAGEGWTMGRGPADVRRIVQMMFTQAGMGFTYDDARATLARVEELGATVTEGVWWLDAALIDATATDATRPKMTEAAQERAAAEDTLAACLPRFIRPNADGWTPPDMETYRTVQLANPALFSSATALVVINAWKRVQARRAQRIEDARNRGVSMIRPIVADLLAMTPQRSLDLGGPQPVATIDGRVFATIDPQVSGDVALLTSVPAIRMMNELVRTAHRQWLENAPDVRTVQFDGGWGVLGERFGGSKSTEWKRILEAGQHISLVWNNITFGGLWTYADKRGGPGAPGWVRIILGDVLLPGAVEQFPKQARSDARRLVPVIDYDVPVGDLDRSKHAAVYRAHYGLMTAMVDRANTIEDRAGVLLAEDDLQRIMRNAGLSPDDLPRVLAAWRDGDDDKAPPLIVQEGQVFRLAEEYHAPQWAFIEEGGKRRRRARASGQASAAKRRAKD